MQKTNPALRFSPGMDAIPALCNFNLKNTVIMSKGVVLLAAASLLLLRAGAQAYEGSAEYNKKKQTAYMVEFTYPQEAVQNAVVQKMATLGYKPREEKGLFNRDKGFLVFKNSAITDVSSRTLDYFVKVDKKGRKDGEGSILTVIVNNSNGENASGFFDENERRRMLGFLNNLQPEVEAANLELQIRDQTDVVTQSEEKLKKLRSDQTDMEKKIKDLQDKIARNLKDQDAAQKDLDNQKQALDALRAKRQPAGQ